MTNQTMTDTSTIDDEDNSSSWNFLKTTWPLGRRHWLELLGALVAVIVLYSIAGLTLSDWLAPNAITDIDQDLAQSLADGRTERNNDLSHWGSFPADTPIKIGASVLVAGFMMWRWRRWHEAVFIGLTLIFEASAYVVSSTIVGRPRPDVERLAESPVATSFPSGHVAAATVYAALAFVVFWHTRNVWIRGLAIALSIALPLGVAWSRLYKGMHFFSDVVAGIVLGLLSIVICYRVLGPPADAVGSPSHSTDRGVQ